MSWLSVVRKHHKGIKDAFGVAFNDPSQENVDHLQFLIDAHSIAEEAAIYPELSKHGMDDEDLEAQQTEAKEQIHYLAKHVDGSNIKKELRKLCKAVLAHAIDHEEKHKFKKLVTKLTAAENLRVEENYLEHYNKWCA